MRNRLLIVTQRVDHNDQLLGFFISWIHRFAEQFETVTVVCQSEGDFELPGNVQVLNLGKAEGVGKFGQMLRFIRILWENRQNYEVVFVHMNPIWAVIGSPIVRALRKRIFLWYTHKSVTLKLRIAARMVHGIFTASKESFRLTSSKLMVTGHGIDTVVFSPDERVPRQPGSLLVVGRIAPVKNLEQLVDAARILLGDGVALHVDIVGAAVLPQDELYERRVRERITHSGYAEHFVFAGLYQHEQLVSLYRSRDIFVHLSRTGSLDKTILEAMACGMKVISCNDASRAFLPEEFHFTADDPQSLARAITNAMESGGVADTRDFVVQHHNLNRLIPLLSERMRTAD